MTDTGATTGDTIHDHLSLIVADGSPTHGRTDVPKVVIFDRPAGHSIEVVPVRPSAGVGTTIDYLGARWRIIAVRTHSRVLICRPTTS